MPQKIQPIISPAICYKCKFSSKKPDGSVYCDKLKQIVNERVRKAGGCLFREEKTE